MIDIFFSLSLILYIIGIINYFILFSYLDYKYRRIKNIYFIGFIFFIPFLIVYYYYFFNWNFIGLTLISIVIFLIFRLVNAYEGADLKALILISIFLSPFIIPLLLFAIACIINFILSRILKLYSHHTAPFMIPITISLILYVIYDFVICAL